jgi:hypothetical protein
MSWQFGRIDLQQTQYETAQDLEWTVLEPVPVEQVQQVYQDYCAHKRFQSVMPMIAGRLTAPNTELFGYYCNTRLVAWSMYRIWDNENVLSDHFAWNYRNPQLRLGIRSIENECAIYRDRGYRYMYFEAVEPYMLDLQGFEILGPLQ